jgi:maltooligosyltrehalose trehalohydrolase
MGDGETRFVVWAPATAGVMVQLADGPSVALTPESGGYHQAVVPNCPPGARYHYVLADGSRQPDPASRSQPDGVHGPSQVVDLRAHPWHDEGYRPRPLWDQVIYELHIGTFTAEGTFDAALAQLDELVELGVSALEIMPVAQFPGRRNWGYDGVFPYAVQNSYGGWDGLQRLVEGCHQRGLAVVLDVVYNHLGPEGNVLGDFGPYFTDRYHTPWGPALNFDGPGSDDVRTYFLQNAHQWFVDFHIDALRLDAVHEIIDRTATPFLSELATHADEISDMLGRRCSLIAESADNNPLVITASAAGGLGLDAQWNDDFHHSVHSVLTGEREGYYADYGHAEDVARAMNEGFVYQGQYSLFRQRRHGAPSGTIAPEHFVEFVQNHDHIGNRPRGDRLATLVAPDQVALAAALLLLSPGIPLLFMGEEYGETAPFPYFVDHGDPALTAAVRTGRAREFAEMFHDAEPLDPADPDTFAAAILQRSLRHQGTHAELWQLYRELIALRQQVPALRRSTRSAASASAYGGVVTMVRRDPAGTVTALFNLTAHGVEATLPSGGPWIDLRRSEQLPHAGDATVKLDPWGFNVYGTPEEAA